MKKRYIEALTEVAGQDERVMDELTNMKKVGTDMKNLKKKALVEIHSAIKKCEELKENLINARDNLKEPKDSTVRLLNETIEEVEEKESRLRKELKGFE